MLEEKIEDQYIEKPVAETEQEPEAEQETETELEAEIETDTEAELETEEAVEDSSVVSDADNEKIYDEQEEAEAAEETEEIEETEEAAATDEAMSTGLPEEEQEEEEKAVELSAEDREIAERIRIRKIETERKRRRHKRHIIEAVVFIVLAITALILSFTPIFTVDSIEVKGNSHYSAEEVISIAHAAPGKNLIYHSDKGSIQRYLESNPYIKSAEVSRKFPSTLVIKVSERTAVMALKYDNDYLILDNEGILLQKSPTKPKLTIVEGNIIKKIKLGQALETEDSDLMSKSTAIIRAMGESDLYFVKLDMKDKYSIKAYVYNSLIVKNDYDLLIENMKNGKLHQVLDKLFSESIKRGTITFNEDGTSTYMPGF